MLQTLKESWYRSAGQIRELLAVPAEYPGTTVTTRRLLNLYVARVEKLLTRSRLHSRPIKLTAEATNVCNLRCPACFTGAGEVGRPRSHLSLDLYRRLLDELGVYLWEVEFYSWGEPLLAKNIFAMIEATAARGIHTTVSTNFSFPFRAEQAERLVASGLSLLGVSIDGARQETYEQYRRRGDLETVLRNCRLVRDAKRRRDSSHPRMVWEFHVFPHNTDDVEPARAMARELEMDLAVEKGWVVGPEWDTEQRYRFFADPWPEMRCLFLWSQAVVNSDGGVSPCCGTFYREDDVGRLGAGEGDGGARTFAEIWNNRRFRLARGLFRSRVETAETRDMICLECPATKIWERYKAHRAAGGARQSFSVGDSTNDCFNFFWNHRPARAAAEGAGGAGGASPPRAGREVARADFR